MYSFNYFDSFNSASYICFNNLNLVNYPISSVLIYINLIICTSISHLFQHNFHRWKFTRVGKILYKWQWIYFQRFWQNQVLSKQSVVAKMVSFLWKERRWNSQKHHISCVLRQLAIDLSKIIGQLTVQNCRWCLPRLFPLTILWLYHFRKL